MPNDLSNEFHSIEDAVKAFFVKALTDLESGMATALSDAATVMTGIVNQAGPIIVAAAAAGVQAALATATGGLSAIASAAEGAAVGVLSTQGVQLAENALLQLKTLILANVLKANSGAAAAATDPASPAQSQA